MSTELTTTGGNGLSVQMDYAKALAVSDMIPREYANKPGNVLIAIGLGQSMGLSPAESLYRISVIQGKPTASAELIAANVRRAGHRLHVDVNEAAPSATATIWRADDPETPTTVTRDMKWAQGMGLASKDNYKKQPATMLSWRAITACARLACPEALYGVVYSDDEMYEVAPAEPRTVADLTNAAPVIDVGTTQPLTEPAPNPAPKPTTEPTPEQVADCTDLAELRTMWANAGPELRAQIEARKAELDTTAPVEGDEA